jgi:hypothetical protein
MRPARQLGDRSNRRGKNTAIYLGKFLLEANSARFDVRTYERSFRTGELDPNHIRTMTDTHRPWWSWLLFIALVPYVLIWAVLWVTAAVVLLLAVWVTWCPRGRYALVVYSNSPIWQEYFDVHVLPAIGNRGIVLNWSDRRRWKYSLPVALFRFFAGTRDFNPLAIVFVPLAWPRRFQFYRAFQAFKHGRPEEVESVRRDFFELLDEVAPHTRHSDGLSRR